MIFPYLPAPTKAPVASLGGAMLRYRPIISVRVFGPLGSRLVDGCVDCGSDDRLELLSERRSGYNAREARMEFRWIEWNIEHLAKHGVDPEEAEMAVRGVRRPYPQQIGDDKLLVCGRGRGGRYLQVVYILDPDDTVFVIHARPLADREKKRYRRRIR